jgi:hypothetical protein
MYFGGFFIPLSLRGGTTWQSQGVAESRGVLLGLLDIGLLDSTEVTLSR